MVIKHKIPCNGWDAVICVNEQGKVLVLKWRNSLPYNGNKIIEDLHEDDNIPGVNYNGLELLFYQ